jgi:cobalt transporter subunit CbtB
MNANARPRPTAALLPTALASQFAQMAGALLLGLVMVYGVEFSDAPMAHNAAHDVRHANGRPCH